MYYIAMCSHVLTCYIHLYVYICLMFMSARYESLPVAATKQFPQLATAHPVINGSRTLQMQKQVSWNLWRHKTWATWQGMWGLQVWVIHFWCGMKASRLLSCLGSASLFGSAKLFQKHFSWVSYCVGYSRIFKIPSGTIYQEYIFEVIFQTLLGGSKGEDSFSGLSLNVGI